MSSSSGLNRAPDISLQLVMHFLDCSEIPRLARCNRRLLRLADTDFAWSRCLVRVLDSRTFAPKQGLLRHAPLHVTWRSKSNPATQGDVASLLAIARSHRVSELDASVCWCVSSVLWRQALTHPSMQHLTLLAMHGGTAGHVTRAMFAALLTLPHLSTLTCRPSVVPEEADMWSQLPLMPSLTKLAIKDSSVAGLSRLPHIALCPKLIDFSVINSDALDGGIIAFCCAPLMAGLRRLKIDGLNRDVPILSVAWIPAFQHLSQLETLELRKVQFIRTIFAQVNHLQSLRHLIFRARCDGPVSDPAAHFIPSPDELVQLLVRLPLLCLTMEVKLAEPLRADDRLSIPCWSIATNLSRSRRLVLVPPTILLCSDGRLNAAVTNSDETNIGLLTRLWAVVLQSRLVA